MYKIILYRNSTDKMSIIICNLSYRFVRMYRACIKPYSISAACSTKSD